LILAEERNRVTDYLSGCFNGSAVSQQQFNHFDVILLAGNMKRRETILDNAYNNAHSSIVTYEIELPCELPCAASR